jgi:hypothetical protein
MDLAATGVMGLAIEAEKKGGGRRGPSLRRDAVAGHRDVGGTARRCLR